MRFSQAEKMEIIRLVEESSLPVKQTLREMDVPRSSFYRWYRRYQKHGISHARGKPYHPVTQGKIERYHRTLKNRINLENHYFPWELEHQIGRFVDYYNHQRVHESLGNLTPADVYHGRAREIVTARDLDKEQTMRRRRRHNLGLRPLKEEVIRPEVYRQCIH